MEFKYPNGDEVHFRSYSLKMVRYEDEEIQCPAELSSDKQAEIRKLVLQTFRAIGCRDYARVDVRMDRAGKPYVLEVNALPNLMPKTSSYAIMALKTGLTFREMIRSILRTAVARYAGA
jgi:D-alanine-D-alanine ligase